MTAKVKSLFFKENVLDKKFLLLTATILVFKFMIRNYFIRFLFSRKYHYNESKDILERKNFNNTFILI